MTGSGRGGLVAFYGELKRRRVVRVVVAYGVAGFGVLEVAGTLFPALFLPEWSVTAVAVLVILGFPVALILAWLFEVTPDGIRRAERPRAESGPGEVPRGYRRRYLAAGLGLGLLVGAIGFGGYALLRAPRAADTDAGEVSGSTIAILPFRYSGDERHAYLGEGIVDLLSTKLDGVGEVRSVDPNALFGVLSGMGEGYAETPGGAREVALRLGAGSHVLGSITEVGGRLQIRATLYGGDGAVETDADVTVEGESELLGAVDEIARQLLADRLGRSGDELTRLAALTSGSVPALRAFLEGERLLRRGDGAGAVDAFERATRDDSLFALAYYELSVARDWGGPGSADEAADRALELRDQLPLQQRELLEAYDLYRSGDHQAARNAYQAILRRTPMDMEAWYGLAEVLFHYGPLSGRRPEEAEEAFRSVLRFQPDHGPSLYHLTSIAAAKEDYARLDSLTAQVVEMDSPYALDLRAQQAFAHGDADRVAGMIAELARPENAARANIGFVLLRTGNLEGVLSLAAALARPDQSADVRGSALRWGALASMAAGRAADARSMSEAAHALGDPYVLAQRSYQAALPFTPTDSAEIRNLRAALLGLEGQALEALSAGGVLPAEAARAALVGLLSARMGDEQDALARATAVEDAAPHAGHGTLLLDLSLEVRALNDFVQGREAAALTTLEAMPLQPALGDFAFVPWFGLAISRLLRAELLAADNRLDEALHWFQVADQGSYSAILNRGPATLGLAEVHDRMGDASAAARHYARFIELWQNSDPALKPLVESARRRLEQLVDGP